MMNQFDSKTIDELEEIAAKCWWILTEIYDTIRRRELHLKRGFKSFWDYLEHQGISRESYYQKRREAQGAFEAEQRGIKLKNGSAAREWRTLAYRYCNDNIYPEFVKAIELAADGEPVTAKHIQAVGEVWIDLIRTGGQVWVDGEYTPYQAAIAEQLIEVYKRQKQHAIDGAKKAGWDAPIKISSWSGIIPVEIPYGAEVKILVRQKCPEATQ